MDITSLVVGVLSSGAVMTFVGSWFGRKTERANAVQMEAGASKQTAEAATLTIEAILKWATALKEEYAERITALEKSVAERDAVIVQLRIQVVAQDFEIKAIKKSLDNKGVING